MLLTLMMHEMSLYRNIRRINTDLRNGYHCVKGYDDTSNDDQLYRLMKILTVVYKDMFLTAP